MMDLSRVPREYNYTQPQNPHRPLTGICSEDGVFLSIRESSFLVYHFAGTFEQFSSRIDSRKNRNWAQYKARPVHVGLTIATDAVGKSDSFGKSDSLAAVRCKLQ
jgi:hypothetical protein